MSDARFDNLHAPATLGDPDAAGPDRPTPRAGGGATTRDLPPRPSHALPSPTPRADARAIQMKATAERQQADFWALMTGQSVQGYRGQLADPDAVQAQAAAGVADAASELPHREAIQRSFGPHDVAGIRAHVGGAAATAAAAIGAEAYATGSSVAFRASPDLHTAAHEAAHVVQQRAGVHLKGGVGQAGDAHEVHADAVADRVVAGRSAVDLLDQYTGRSGGPAAVQRKGASESELSGVPERFTEASAATARLNPAHSLIQRTKASVALLESQVEAGTTAPGPARARLTSLTRDLYDPLAKFSEAAAGPQDPDLAATLSRWRPDVLDALNEIARASILIDRAMAGGAIHLGAQLTTATAGREELRSAISALGVVGSGVGWSPPPDLAAADAARDAYQPCRDGSQISRPGVCQYSDTERGDLRTQVQSQALTIVGIFTAVCDDAAADLEPLLKARKEARKAVVDIFAELITIGVTMAAPEAAPIVAAATREVGHEGKPSAVAEGLTDALKKALNPGIDAIKDSLVELDETDAPEAGTINMVHTLAALVSQQMRDLGPALRGATDDELTQLLGRLQSVTKPLVKSRVYGFVSRYRAQIEPIGNGARQDNSFGMGVAYGEHLAARITLGRVARPALIKRVRSAGAGPLAKGRDAGERYVFVRWIDADMQAMAGPLTDLAGTDIDGLPLGEVMADAAPVPPAASAGATAPLAFNPTPRVAAP